MKKNAIQKVIQVILVLALYSLARFARQLFVM